MSTRGKKPKKGEDKEGGLGQLMTEKTTSLALRNSAASHPCALPSNSTSQETKKKALGEEKA